MKKIVHLLLVACGLFLTAETKANPIVIIPPQAFLSEVYIQTSNNWSLEMEMFIPVQYLSLGYDPIDSIIITSNTGKGKVLSFTTVTHAIFVINNSLLSNNVAINPSQDTLTVYTYLNPQLVSNYYLEPYYMHKLVFGYPTCEIPVLTPGQSICARERNYGNPEYFYLDNSPTIGFENDTTGASATIHGHFYDCRDSLITYSLNNFSFALWPNVESIPNPHPLGVPPTFWVTLYDFSFDEQGFFTSHVLARNSSEYNVFYLWWSEWNPYGADGGHDLSCLPFTYDLEPGQTQQQDIHLTDTTFLVGIPAIQPSSTSDVRIVCAPNPLKTSTSLFISSNHILKNPHLRIIDNVGKVLKEFKLPDGANTTLRISKEEIGSAGMFIYSLLENNKPVCSGYLICE
jgi:hypothetical protein